MPSNTTIINLTASGGTISIDPQNLVDGYYVVIDSPITLTNNFSLDTSSVPSVGTRWHCAIIGLQNLTLNSFTVNLFGQVVTTNMIASAQPWILWFEIADTVTLTGTAVVQPMDFKGVNTLSGQLLLDGTTALSKLTGLTAGQLILGDATDVPTATTVTGDVTINSSGVTAIGAGVIVNNDINASAAIARTKLASGTASHVLINDGSGVMTSEAQLAATRGGLGLNAGSSTGFVTFSGGTASIGAISEVLRAEVSFEAGEQGTYYITVPYACTVTEAKARVTKAIAGTDDATIQLRNNSGTNMTSGLVTLPASSAHGVGATASPSANNTFTAGQEIQLVVAKPTAGGKASVDIILTRNA